MDKCEGKLIFLEGDATKPEKDGKPVHYIMHIVNDVGAWGAGFTRSLSALSTEPERVYRILRPKLGSIQIVPIDPREGFVVMDGEDVQFGSLTPEAKDNSSRLSRPL